jgi:acyl-CoA thioester hydrolase
MEKEISTPTKIRFADCDPLGHLNNVRYLDYMLNAREDHVELQWGFSYEEYTKKTGCSWVAIQNEIAYLREVRYNTKVQISSKLIELNDRTVKVEIQMKSTDSKIIFAVLWATAIYFNVKTRKSELHPESVFSQFQPMLVSLPENIFSERISTLRKLNQSSL